MRFAERVLGQGDTIPSAGGDLLHRRSPRLQAGDFSPLPDESPSDFAVRMVTSLDRTTLPVQGPPGTGKTYVGARMIRTAVAEGKRVGVTATSHKVIQNLLDEVHRQAVTATEEVRIGRKVTNDDLPDYVRGFRNNADALTAIAAGDIHVLGELRGFGRTKEPRQRSIYCSWTRPVRCL